MTPNYTPICVQCLPRRTINLTEVGERLLIVPIMSPDIIFKMNFMQMEVTLQFSDIEMQS